MNLSFLATFYIFICTFVYADKDINEECPMTIPSSAEIPRCSWVIRSGQQLNFFQPLVRGVSICVKRATSLDHCKLICEQVYPGCVSVHYCVACETHNCRLLTQRQDGPKGLNLLGLTDLIHLHQINGC